MAYEEIRKEILRNYAREDYYRFDLNLPKSIIGRGRKHEIYVAPFECKPWVNGDCKIPIEYLEGAMVKEILDDRVILSFILGRRALSPFLTALGEITNMNDVELVSLDS